MIIIAGGGHIKSKKHQQLESSHCPICNNSSRWMVEKNQHFATLFFLPVLPYKTEYVTYCIICRNGQFLSKEHYEEAIRKASELP